MYLVFCTCPDKKTAKSIGLILVKEKIAACVNILNVTESIYMWKGELVQDQECLLIAKIPKEHFVLLKNRIIALHPYTVPEIVALHPSQVNEKYLKWVNDL